MSEAMIVYFGVVISLGLIAYGLANFINKIDAMEQELERYKNE